ncbi:class I SAM-dependent RNA methyltransferase [Sphingomonas sp. SM33]|uniref:Class I SAM-dependent RNA methyltransferase n=1 Tax=Sphingomonas telluris TaxID=2907998 RepID=A0ABS9VKD6_9SPHN|nr:class I SAM-dependent RNA methyltransferase [Sphingomonas telluris]MCH8615415.1 class I SAM-dependent RNA methyltransferase [Sphingomonas telluris]
MPEDVVRIAARGDGVTASGRHVPFGVPGDTITDDGSLTPGPHHQKPPCRHFPECGGCQLQHVDDEAYRSYLVSRLETALDQHDLQAEVRVPHLSPPNSRRRATLRALKVGKGAVVGFNAAKSHRIVDMRENHILRPELVELVGPLRELIAGLLMPRRTGEVQLTLVDQGVDVMLKGVEPQGLQAMEALTAFCERHKLARLSIDQGLGPETLFEPVPTTISLSGTPVTLPVGAFLQATADGEAALVDCVREAVGNAERIADLFAGLGTFALALKGKVYAAEASRDAVLALKRAASTIAVEHRDLYRRPLDVSEINNFDAVVLDPPRAGAEQQMNALAGSAVRKIAYESCNPATFARDARMLVDGGYSLEWVRPVGQFRWSTHVELAAAFSR